MPSTNRQKAGNAGRAPEAVLGKIDTTILRLFSDDQLKEEIFRRIAARKARANKSL